MKARLLRLIPRGCSFARASRKRWRKVTVMWISVLFAVFLFSSVSEVLFGSKTFHRFFLTFSCIGLHIVNRANWLRNSKNFKRSVQSCFVLGSVHKLQEGGMGDLREGGGPENFLHQKGGGGGDLKWFQNIEVRTWNIWRVQISKAVFYKVVRQFNHWIVNYREQVVRSVFMFYVSIIFQKNLQVYSYSSILIIIFTCNQWEISSIYDTFYQTKQLRLGIF